MESENKQSGEKEKIELIFKKILRYDFYVNSTNAKASLIIAWNGVVIGTILLKYNEIISLYANVKFAYYVATLFLLIIGFASVISIALVFQVVNPFLTASHNKDGKSLFFFGSVAKLSFNEYKQKELESTYSDTLSDLIEQSYVISDGLNKKMNSLQKSIKAINYQLLFLLLLILLKGLINYR